LPGRLQERQPPLRWDERPLIELDTELMPP
jgi:hypothetical protein